MLFSLKNYFKFIISNVHANILNFTYDDYIIYIKHV
jgi:hypothetical protein